MFPLKTAGRLICFGDLCIDVVARSAALNPSLESDTTIEQLHIRVAGSAANCALAAVAAGAIVNVIGLVGDDDFGNMIIDKLSKARVGTAFIQRRAEDQTGVVISQVRPNGDRTFLSYRGANTQPYGTLPASLLTADDYLFLSGYSLQNEASAQTSLALKKVARTVAFDPTYLFAKDYHSRYAEHLAGIDILTPNWEEAQLMTGQTTPSDCAAALRDLGVTTVIVKLGADGCYVLNEQFHERIPVAPVTGRVDTTGAGDAFCGTLLANCLQGANLLEAATAANEAARRLICS